MRRAVQDRHTSLLVYVCSCAARHRADALGEKALQSGGFELYV